MSGYVKMFIYYKKKDHKKNEEKLLYILKGNITGL